MQGKAVEDTKTVIMHGAQSLQGTTATFGGWVDTMGYSSAKVVLNVGSIAGSTTLAAIIYEKEADTGTAGAGDLVAVPVTGADFGSLSSTNDRSVLVGGIETRNYKRYLALRVVAGQSRSANPTVGFSAQIELYKGDSDPSDVTPTFDVDACS